MSPQSPQQGAPQSPRSLREATLWRIVRHIYLRAVSRLGGRDLFASRTEEQELALERFHADIERDVDVLAAVMDEARAAGITAVHRRMHIAEGTDHEMVDQAIEFAREDEEA